MAMCFCLQSQIIHVLVASMVLGKGWAVSNSWFVRSLLRRETQDPPLQNKATSLQKALASAHGAKKHVISVALQDYRRALIRGHGTNNYSGGFRGHKRSDPLFCSLMSGSPSDARYWCGNESLYCGPTQIYIAHADPPLQLLEQFNRVHPLWRRPAVYMTVAGSFSGLNGLLTVEPQEGIIFYDINPWVLEYVQMLVALIRVSPSRESFLNAIYGRNMKEFLFSGERLHEAIYGQGERDPLEIESDQKILHRTLEKLPKESRCAYQHLQDAYMSRHGSRTAESGEKRQHRNCEMITLFHPPHHSPALEPTRAGLYIDSKHYTPNTCTFYYGFGWLKNETTYSRIRHILSNTRSLFIQNQVDSVLREAQQRDWNVTGKSVVAYVSNIRGWSGERAWSKQIARIQKARSDLYVVGTDWSKHYPRICAGVNGKALLSGSGSSHRNAWEAVAAALNYPLAKGTTILEVSRRVPWGFDEIGEARSNIEVFDYISNDSSKPDVVILHILVGEGEERTIWRKALLKALNQAKRVLILEHNAASLDWLAPRQDVTNFFSFEGIASEFHQLAPGRQVSGCTIPGNLDTSRNMLFLVDPDSELPKRQPAALSENSKSILDDLIIGRFWWRGGFY